MDGINTSLDGLRSRDHGGDLAAARARFGPGDWIDLSTGINPVPYPLPEISRHAWTRLPEKSAIAALCDAARHYYGCAPNDHVIAAAGASAIIASAPQLAPPGNIVILSPTYTEHAAAFQRAGWRVKAASEPEAADALVIVSPNNPDGRRWSATALRVICTHYQLVVLDESFMDVTPNDSLVGEPLPENIVVIKSFGKFFGLAGLRLGFAICAEPLAHRLRECAGPWPVSGPAVEIGIKALQDQAWHKKSLQRVIQDAACLDTLALAAGWRIVGGANLFRTYQCEDAAQAHRSLAKQKIWTRIFPYSDHWLRLGAPGSAAHWRRLAAALGT
jgi:cobalamin biosynthetic protein CobC